MPAAITQQDINDLKGGDDWDAKKREHLGYRKHQNEGHRELHEIDNPEDAWKKKYGNKPFSWQTHDEVHT